MPKYRVATPEEMGNELAGMLASLHVELIKRGIDTELASRLAAQVAGAASSNSDGHCGDLLRSGEEVINPAMQLRR